MYHLVIAKGRHQGRSVKLKHFPFIIGRQKDCSLRAVSMEISRQHCAIESDGDQVWIKDLGSTNGVLINNHKISGKQELHDRDILQIGPLTLQFKTAAATADSHAGAIEQAAVDESTPMPAAFADMDEDAAATLLMNLEDLQPAAPAKPDPKPEPAKANTAQSILERYKKK